MSGRRPGWWGYLLATLGVLAGGALGVAIGSLTGATSAVWVANEMLDTTVDADGVEGFLATIALVIGAIVLAALVFVIAIGLAAWLGSVVGCAISLRVGGCSRSWTTALFAGAIELPLLLLLAAGSRLASLEDTMGIAIIAPVAAIGGALLGRWLATRREAAAATG